MKLQRLYSYTRKAIEQYNMIEQGDKIAIGVSGGKDSLTLLHALAGIKKFYPKSFDVEAVSVNLGFENQNFESICEFCDSLEIQLHIVDTQISKIVFDKRNEKNPCALCAKLRKGALNEYALSIGCNKVAYGHHKDDIIETMLLSLIYEGRFYSFPPVTYLEKTGITVIRPMMFVSEAEIKGFTNLYNLPIAKNPCPADGHTRREYVKELLKKLNTDNPGVKERMFGAILNGNIEDWNYI